MSPASTSPITDLWLSLPEELKVKLRLGFTGKLHLLDIAGWCLRSGNPGLNPICTSALQTAFGENPLDGEMLTELLSHNVVRTLLPADSITAMEIIAGKWRKPDNTSYFERLLEKRDFPKIKRYIEQNAEREPENLFWREQALAFGLMDDDLDWADQLMNFALPTGAEAVTVNIQARLASLRGDCSDAARLSMEVGETFGRAFPVLRAGLCMLAHDDMASGHMMLLQAVSHEPWNVNLLLRAHDLLAGLDTKSEGLPGTVAILLYSWNKAMELDATLHSLLQSDLSNATIFVLDNGSTDSTPEILKSWQLRYDSQLGVGRMKVVTLPTNIGAPPARNWLMHMNDVQKYDFICYLDDDVELPSDWLGKLGAAIREYPDAGVWGCKVVDHANPVLIQSGDAHLLVEQEEIPMQLDQTAPNPFKLSDLHIQSMDSGLMDFMRPCASVTGCCHIFRTSVLMESGDFAIHLSPSQYDDMEHDIRLCAAGKFPVYQGHLSILHKKRTGAASRLSMQEEGNALGNKYKMQTMHTRKELIESMQAEQELLEKDLLRKIHIVENGLLR